MSKSCFPRLKNAPAVPKQFYPWKESTGVQWIARVVLKPKLDDLQSIESVTKPSVCFRMLSKGVLFMLAIILNVNIIFQTYTAKLYSQIRIFLGKLACLKEAILSVLGKSLILLQYN
jgi:hypothetical protein